MSRLKPIFFIGIFLYALTSQAQDRHYWSQMGGINAGLLGGSAIAGLKENNSMYYNPATMAFAENPSLSLDASTFNFSRTKFDNPFGEGSKTFINSFIINPDMVGGLLFSKKNGKIRTGYAIATKVIAKDRFFGQANIPRSDLSTFIGNFDTDVNTLESWLNVATSYTVNEHFSLGVTFVLAARSENYSGSVSAKIFPVDQNESVQRFDSKTVYNYWNLKGIVKLGTALNYDKFRFGWNLVLPSVNLYGLAKTQREISIANNNSTNSNIPQNVAIIGHDEDIPTHHKYPVTSGIGFSFKLNSKSWLHCSVETFFEVKPYDVFKSDEEVFDYPTGSADSLSSIGNVRNNFLAFSESAKMVTNFSVGYENQVTENMGILAGLRTNFNFNNEAEFYSSKIEPIRSTWNQYLASGGIRGKYKDKFFTVGLELGYTPQTETNQLANFHSEAVNYSPWSEAAEQTTVSEFSLRLFLGVEIHFIPD